ncbi:MAG TPA: type II methionyl aminopeptidase [Nitrososphaeraceae archaeon]|jgi:methionyl aminopeptidase|nr:type II methionyl aminopeptidase [Nitrososphaeraceae archaeon]
MDLLECYLKAGKIASEQREKTRKKDHVGCTLLMICESIEREIKESGGTPAFPVNVSLNDIAAHYTAEPNDETTVNENDILKVDIGVHVEGYIADTAVTVSYDPRQEALIKSAENALNEAVRIARVNTKASEIGNLIENTISKMGFKPIQNLSGHSLAQYTIHAGKSIPNIRTIGPSFGLSSNQAYAIEPFVTVNDGQGVVYEGNTRNIFAIISRKPTKDQNVDKFLTYLWNKFRTLPFALRWILDSYEEIEARRMLDVLVKKRNVHAYPTLIEGNNKLVAQAEHTIMPINGSTRVITL